MNIVRLTTRIYPDIGGSARYAFMLSKNLSSANLKFFNISSKNENTGKSNSKILNPYFRIYYLPVKIPAHKENLINKILFTSKFLYFSIKRIIKLHTKHRIDLIHADNPSITGIVSFILGKILGIPFIYTQHGIESPYLLDYLFELNLIYHFAEKYIIISRKMEKYFELNNKNLEKLEWIPNGVNIEEFYHVQSQQEKRNLIKELGYSEILNPTDFIILCIGYMEIKQKVLGMIDLLYGFKTFLEKLGIKESENIKLVYIGTGAYENILKEEINETNLQNVLFLGKQLQIKKFYAIADICCLTSYMEGLPTVLLEAIASEVPCIATDVGENKEILDDISLVEPGNTRQIAQKLKMFYRSESHRKEVIKRNLEKIQKFDWNTIGKKLKSLYLNSIFNQ